MNSKPRRVAVALSGGIDSAAAAAVLKDAGHDVIGITALVPLAGGGLATGVDAARSVAASLGIPHEVIDLREQFRRLVIDPFIEAYASGITPNPCVTCNRAIKFGILYDEALGMGCDAYATGHYARTDTFGGSTRLRMALDERRDQSYVLWRLTGCELPGLMFPVGGMSKDRAVEIARRSGVSCAAPESRDACFLAGRGLASLFDGHPAVRPGPIVDLSGKPLGRHAGLALYTVGQRHGLGLGIDRARYVVEIKADENMLVVGGREDLPVESFPLREVSFAGSPPSSFLTCRVRTRYRGPLLDCRFEPRGEDGGVVTYPRPGPEAVPGQSAVFYDGNEVIGGGIIAARRHPA